MIGTYAFPRSFLVFPRACIVNCARARARVTALRSSPFLVLVLFLLFPVSQRSFLSPFALILLSLSRSRRSTRVPRQTSRRKATFHRVRSSVPRMESEERRGESNEGKKDTETTREDERAQPRPESCSFRYFVCLFLSFLPPLFFILARRCRW